MKTNAPGWLQRATQRQEYIAVACLTSGFMLARTTWVYLHRGAAALTALTTARVLSTVGYEVILFGAVAWLLIKRGWPARAILGRPEPEDAPSAAGIGCAVFVIALTLAGIGLYLQHHGLIAPLRHQVARVAWPAALALTIVNPIVEEMLWLGYWYHKVRARSPWLAGTISVGLRTLAHLWKIPVSIVSFAAIPLFGVLFAAYYERTRRLWPLIIVHMLMDGLSLFALQRMM